MKKNVYLLLIAFVLMPLSIFSQSYSDLWKQVEQAADKDLPREQMKVLRKISDKATKEKRYGQLLKAQLVHTSLQVSIAPDSLEPAVRQLIQQAEAAEKQDAALAAVYNNILGSICRRNNVLVDDKQLEPDDFFRKSLADPAMLAAHKAGEFEPLVQVGPDSKVFNDDLLSLLGYNAEDYHTLNAYYDRVGNRRAALLTALDMVRKDHPEYTRLHGNAAYAAALDSLIACYGDLEECGEVAIAQYQFASGYRTKEQNISYIDEALKRWGSWKRMNILRNERKELTRPNFMATISQRSVRPGIPIEVKFKGVCNIREINISVQRVDIDGLSYYSVDDKNHYRILQQKLVAGTRQTYQRRFEGKTDYEEIDDTVVLDGLPLGAYLIEVTTDNPKITPDRVLLYVSDLFVLHEKLPGKKIRFAVLNATTGQPVAGARLQLTTRNPNNEKLHSITCNDKGEVIYEYDSYDIAKVYASTATDKCFKQRQAGWGDYEYYENKSSHEVMTIYTDRRIYRPGQTVHVSAIVFNKTDNWETKALDKRNCTITLRDANYKVVKEAQLTTDEFGTVSADFVLPQNGLTGNYSLMSNIGGGYTSVRVEEYKRPTFEVEFDEVKEKYQNGDTITVTGRARSYAGVPVQGAKVKYEITRRKAMWCWWWSASEEKDLDEGEAVTDDKGEFQIRMPMVLPDWEDCGDDIDEKEYYRIPRFYNIIAHATVTDQGGESHEGRISVPIGSKPTAFHCDIAERSEREQLKSFSFSLKNAAGKDIDGTVRYTIDGKPQGSVAANKEIPLNTKKLTSGRHVIEATCGNDSIRQEFIVFSLSDKSPCIETKEWFYKTDDTFPRDGKPVTIQVGSSDPDVHILYNIFAGNRILESGTVDQSNALYTRQFWYEEEYGTGLLLTFAWVKDGEIHSYSTTISRPLPDKKLKMKWVTFRDRLVPGQQEEWTLNILDPDGKPATAQLMATLYDKSLDQLLSFNWHLYLGISQGLPHTQWMAPSFSALRLSGIEMMNNLPTEDLVFSHFVHDITSFRLGYTLMGAGGGRRLMYSRLRTVEEKMAAPMVEMAMADNGAVDEVTVTGYAPVKKSLTTGSVASTAAAQEVIASDDDNMEADEPQLRENLNETAFFYPMMTTDVQGNVGIKFTLPESITTWRFIGLAHDKDMNNGILGGEAVAKKDVMVQPNMPRFVRVGDHAVITTKIFNTCDHDVSGNARIQLIDPDTEQTVYEQSVPFDVKAGGTGNASFEYVPDGKNALLICRIMASGEGFSDGEQHYLPILPSHEMVVNTVPITQHEPGTVSIDLTKLFPQSSSDRKLTVEYTNNPAWLMVQSLPFVGNPNEENAISLAAAYYANRIGKYLIGQSPRIKTVFQQWQQEKSDENSLMSSLQKNQELKTLLIDETPWVMDAERESDQKKALVNFFDENTMNNRLKMALENLKKLQNGDGSFSWWKGMMGSPSMTAEVMEFLTRLNMLVGRDGLTITLLNQANNYLSGIVIKEVEEMKKREKEKKPVYINGYHALQWVYLNAIAGRALNAKEREATNYLMKYLEKQIRNQSLYAKALMAVVLKKQGQTAKALEYVQSLKEYTVFTEEMGRYYDSSRAAYSWCDYRIPTQTAVIEALKLITPEDKQTIEEMKRWLLQEKRTQSWDTPINSVNAVFAFLNGNTSLLANQEQARLSIDGAALELPQATAGIGYVKTAVPVSDAGTFTVEKSSTGTSWGAVYARFMQPASEVEQAASGISVTREVLHQGPLKVGDKVTVRLTIKADRDYDFVQLVDKRAACMEPVNQLSGYHWGYYCAPKDNCTNYYFDLLSKGRHVIETEYYIDRPGTYETGTCTVQCAYSPEFTGRGKSQTLQVK